MCELPPPVWEFVPDGVTVCVCVVVETVVPVNVWVCLLLNEYVTTPKSVPVDGFASVAENDPFENTPDANTPSDVINVENDPITLDESVVPVNVC